MNLSVSLHFQLPVNLCVKLSINPAVHQSDSTATVQSISNWHPHSPIAACPYVVIITWRCCPSGGKRKVRQVGGGRCKGQLDKTLPEDTLSSSARLAQLGSTRGNNYAEPMEQTECDRYSNGSCCLPQGCGTRVTRP